MLLLCQSTASAAPTLKTLKEALKSVVNWHSLGVSLGIEDYQLRTIENTYYHGERCMTETLIFWLKSTTNPTWKDVAEALDQMDEHRVADEIRRKYITSITTSEGRVLLQLSRYTPV